MLAQYITLIYIGVLSYLTFSIDSLIPKVHRNSDKVDLINNVVVDILENCNLGLKNVMLFDNTTYMSTFDALATIQPPIAVLLKKNAVIDMTHRQPDTIVNQGFIFVVEYDPKWKIIYRNMNFHWPCILNCIAIAIMKPENHCNLLKVILMSLARMYINTSYFVCLLNGTHPVIYTTDTFGDTKPAHWTYENLNEVVVYNQTIYRRFYDKASSCQGFTFNRTNPLKRRYALIGIVTEVNNFNESNPGYYSSGPIKEITNPNAAENINNIRAILNMEFHYRVRLIPLRGDTGEAIVKMISAEHTVMTIEDVTIIKPYELFDHAYPVSHDHYGILSHNQGLATPLEKIAKFYGIWTLVSLIAILIATFIVIWIKTRKNISHAAFDVLRLLINSEVFVPINTLSIKVFFTVIFIYFIVIHATFTGNLSKFLTIPTLRDNIDTVEDLANPRIQTIHDYYFTWDENVDNYRILKSKAVKVHSISQCFFKTLENPYSACLGTMEAFQSRRARNDTNNKLYVSKNRFIPAAAGPLYRKRMPYRERFDWAFMALTETRLYNRVVREMQKNFSMMLKKKEVMAHIDFRPISLKDLTFAFIFLSFGLSLGFFCFLVEIIIGWKHEIDFKKLPKILTFKKKTKVRRINIQPL